MSEHLREIRITVYVDTTKWTHNQSFSSMAEAVRYYNDLSDLTGEVVPVPNDAAENEGW